MEIKLSDRERVKASGSFSEPQAHITRSRLRAMDVDLGARKCAMGRQTTDIAQYVSVYLMARMARMGTYRILSVNQGAPIT